MALSQEQIDFFWENGYLALGKILDDDLIQTLRREYDGEFEKAWRDNRLNNLMTKDWDSDLEAKKSAPQKMLQITQMCERNIEFMRLLYHDAILDAVQDLIGPNIMLFHDQALFKPAQHGGPVFWHQDNAYWKCRPATLVSCWLTLDDVDRENGAMQVIPGSHLKPVWHEKSESTNILFDIEDKIEKDKAVVIDLPAGGAMLHHCQTLHYTQPNATERQRRAFAIHCMPPGTRGHDGEIMRAGFHHPILRMNI